MDSHGKLHSTLRALHYIFPAILLAYYVIAQSVSICTLQSLRSRGRKIQRKPIVVLQCAILILYTIDVSLLVLDALTSRPSNSSTDSNVYALLEVFIWTILNATLIESGNNIAWYPLYGSWTISIVAEMALFGLEIPTTTPFKHEAPRLFKYVQLTLQVLRLAFLALLLLLYFHWRTTYQSEKVEESASLLRSGDNQTAKVLTQSLPTYGSIGATSSESLKDEENDAAQIKEDRMKQEHLQKLKQSGNWINYLRRFSVFVPLLWPAGQVHVQLSILGIVVCLVTHRVLNLLVPRQLGIVIDSLPNTLADQTPFPSMQLGLLVLYRFLASYSTIGELESMLWLPFGQHAVKSVKAAAHKKVMALSRDFQSRKSSGEIIRSIDQGLTVIWLFRKVSMYILPYALDMLFSGIYLSYVFGTYMALLLGVTAIVYLWVSARLAARRINPQREVLKMDRREAQVLYESVGEWDTVSYFGGQTYENDRLSRIIGLRLLSEFNLNWLVVQGNFWQEAVMELGFTIACALVIYQIVQGTQKIGTFAMMIFYFLNAQSYFQSLITMGSSFLRDLVECETLRDLLLTEPSVKDGPAPFRFSRGAVLFSNVSFGYDDQKTVIQDFNFSAEAGQRIALVGETGAGKTTVLRLLFRFYDVQTGKIMIDGQDIRNVTLSTLRNVMGVVPQDPSLFDSSIMENVRYSRFEASDEEVVEACKAAAIHDKILTYIDGYDTKVGEHGMKLSGGEKQRIAIARVMLKNPKIILLDEATSSVDSETESHIQTALQRLTSGRTTFTIAHRLSTIKGSDIILVMRDGSIVEQGSPSKLLQGNGQFSKLWKRQFELEHDRNVDKTITGDESGTEEQAKPASSRHISEQSESSFRPDAPEFVPNYQRSTAASSGQPAHMHLIAGHQHGQENVTSHAHSHSVAGKSDSGLANRIRSQRNKKQSKSADESEATSQAVTANSRPNTADSQYDGPAGVLPTDNKPQPRLNRWQRRHQARSEPHGSSMGSSQADGISASLYTNEAEAKTTSRRVSSPGSYPSGATILKPPDQDSKSSKGFNQNIRRKRQRQLRMKRIEQSGSGSGVLSGEASSAWSSDSLLGSRPKTPISTSENEVNLPTNKEINDAANPLGRQSTSNVHFAPEA